VERSFVEVGRALATIRDGGLYVEQGFKSFESYCATRWDMKRAHAYRLIDGAAVVANVSHGRHLQPPTVERHCRELAKLPAEAQAEAWAEAVETAPPSGITAKHVAEVVLKRLPPLAVCTERGDTPAALAASSRARCGSV